MDDGRYVVEYSTLGHHRGSVPTHMGTVDHLGNGVIQQSSMVQPASYTAVYASQAGLYAPETSSQAFQPQLQIGYGAPLIQPYSQPFEHEQVYYGGSGTQQTIGPIQTTLTHNPPFTYQAEQQQYNVYHEPIGTTDSGATSGYIKSTIPTASGTSTPALSNVNVPVANRKGTSTQGQIQEPVGNNVVSIKVDGYDYNNVSVTAISDPSTTTQAAVDVHQVDVTPAEVLNVTSVSSTKTTKQGVRQKAKAQGVAQTGNAAATTAGKRKVPQKNAKTTEDIVPKQATDTTKVVKKKQVVSKQNVDKTNIGNKKEAEIDVGVSASTDQTESDGKRVKRKSKVKTQPALVADPFVEQVQSARAAKVKVKTTPKKKGKGTKHSQVSEEIESRVLDEPMHNSGEQRHSRIPVTEQDVTEEVSVSEHTHTRVRVVHVTEDGTLSIRPVDKNKKLANKNTSKTSSIQTQTDTASVMETGTSHVEEGGSEQVVWTAGASQTMDMSIHGAENGDAISESGDGSSNEPEPDYVTDRKLSRSENTYATVIKPLGKESVILYEPDDPETDEPPPVPNKTQRAFEPIYSNHAVGEQAIKDDNISQVELHVSELTASELRACADIDACLEDPEDPYASISDVHDGSNDTGSQHDTIASSSTNTTEYSTTSESTYSEVKEPESERIRRLAKEKRRKGLADTYEDIILQTEGNDDVASSDQHAVVQTADVRPKTEDDDPKQDDTISNGVTMVPAAQQDMRNLQHVGSAPPIAIKTPISLPLGFRLNNAFNVYFHGCDITKLKADVIVNAANSKLKHDNGVAKAIAKAAGKDLEQDSKQHIKKNGAIEVGDVVSTKPGKLQCAYVFHAVGPRYKDYTDKNACINKLRDTYNKVFETCMMHKVPSVAIPPLSAGKFGVPHQLISACIHETLLAAAINPNYRYLKIVHIINIEPAIILPVAEALATRPALLGGVAVKVELLDRREVRRTLEQCVTRKKSAPSSKKTKDSKTKSSESKSRDKKSRDGKASSSSSNNSSQRQSLVDTK